MAKKTNGFTKYVYINGETRDYDGILLPLPEYPEDILFAIEYDSKESKGRICDIKNKTKEGGSNDKK